eukprot:1092173-Prorocentrum_lima.AAC.1
MKGCGYQHEGHQVVSPSSMSLETDPPSPMPPNISRVCKPSVNRRRTSRKGGPPTISGSPRN